MCYTWLVEGLKRKFMESITDCVSLIVNAYYYNFFSSLGLWPKSLFPSQTFLWAQNCELNSLLDISTWLFHSVFSSTCPNLNSLHHHLLSPVLAPPTTTSCPWAHRHFSCFSWIHSSERRQHFILWSDLETGLRRGHQVKTRSLGWL